MEQIGGRYKEIGVIEHDNDLEGVHNKDNKVLEGFRCKVCSTVVQFNIDKMEIGFNYTYICSGCGKVYSGIFKISNDAVVVAKQKEQPYHVPVDTPSPQQDNINHPKHYTSHPLGIECIDIIEYFNFNVGNAIKYLWRCGLKGDEIEDLKKAEWYVRREIIRRIEEKR